MEFSCLVLLLLQRCLGCWAPGLVTSVFPSYYRKQIVQADLQVVKESLGENTGTSEQLHLLKTYCQEAVRTQPSWQLTTTAMWTIIRETWIWDRLLPASGRAIPGSFLIAKDYLQGLPYCRAQWPLQQWRWPKGQAQRVLWLQGLTMATAVRHIQGSGAG